MFEGKFLICNGMVDNLIVYIDGWFKLDVGVDCCVLLFELYLVDVIVNIVFGLDVG